MENFTQQPPQKMPLAAAWILCGVVIFSGIHSLFSFMFNMVEFGFWYAKLPASVLTIWKGITVPLNVLITIISVVVIANRLKNTRNLPKVFTVVMGIVWLLLAVAGEWMFSLTIPVRARLIFDEDFKTFIKVENMVRMLNNVLYILTLFISFLLFMNRKQPGQE